jgi:hypothetical protein
MSLARGRQRFKRDACSCICHWGLQRCSAAFSKRSRSIRCRCNLPFEGTHGRRGGGGGVAVGGGWAIAAETGGGGDHNDDESNGN